MKVMNFNGFLEIVLRIKSIGIMKNCFYGMKKINNRLKNKNKSKFVMKQLNLKEIYCHKIYFIKQFHTKNNR
jgi:hypothetical protein